MKIMLFVIVLFIKISANYIKPSCTNPLLGLIGFYKSCRKLVDEGGSGPFTVAYWRGGLFPLNFYMLMTLMMIFPCYLTLTRSGSIGRIV